MMQWIGKCLNATSHANEKMRKCNGGDEHFLGRGLLLNTADAANAVEVIMNIQ